MDKCVLASGDHPPITSMGVATGRGAGPELPTPEHSSLWITQRCVTTRQ